MPRPRKFCRFCNAKLTVHQRAKQRCESVECRRRYDAVRRRLRQMRRASQLRRMVEEACARRCEELAAREIANPNDFTTIIIPANLRSLRNLADRRRSRLREHLQEIISAVTEHRAEDVNHGVNHAPQTSLPLSSDKPFEKEIPSQVLPVIQLACTTCQGACCVRGENSAYLKPKTIHRYMQAHPELRPRDVLAAYLDAVPNKTYDGSCVYHGPTGCGLARDMRSDICNRFHCTQLEEVILDAGDSPPENLFVAAADVVSGRVIRTTVKESAVSAPSMTLPEEKNRQPAEPKVYVDIDPATL